MIFFTVRHSTFNIRYSILNSPRKLLEESEVVFEKQPQVAYLVLQQGDPFNTHTKSKSCVNRTVNPAIVKHCRVYHPATQDLNPAGIFAYITSLTSTDITGNIKFSRRFGKGEKRRPEANLSTFAEHLPCKIQ